MRKLLINGEAQRIRLSSNLSLSEMARALEISPSTLWRWEHRERTPGQELATRYLTLIRELEAANE